MSKSKLNAGDFGLPDQAECPFCNRSDTELHSPFGSQLSVSTYWCKRCYTAFEYLKWQPATPDKGLPLG